jgi:alpha-glucoside transport system permease protein
MSTTMDPAAEPTVKPKDASMITAAGKRAHAELSSPLASFVVIFLAVIWTIPTFGVLISSIRPAAAVARSGWWTWFTDPSVTLDNYREVFLSGSVTSPPLLNYFVNSLVISIPGAIFPLALATFAAYALAWFEFRGREWLFLFIFALQVVPLQLSLIPLLRIFVDLGWGGTFLPIWIAHTCFAMPLAIFLIHNFIAQLPRELIEAAKVDGAGPFTIFRRVVLPLSTPAIASFAIFQFLWVWNDLLVALVFGSNRRTAPMMVRLAELTGTRGAEWHLLTAGAFVAIIVPLIVFFSLQRYFVRGLLAGSVKG